MPLDLAATGADAYTVSAHKWLLAPTGSGLLYVRSGGAPWIAPTQLDEGASYTQCTGTTPYQTIAARLRAQFLEAAGGLDATTRYAPPRGAHARACLPPSPRACACSRPRPRAGSQARL